MIDEACKVIGHFFLRSEAFLFFTKDVQVEVFVNSTLPKRLEKYKGCGTSLFGLRMTITRDFSQGPDAVSYRLLKNRRSVFEHCIPSF